MSLWPLLAAGGATALGACPPPFEHRRRSAQPARDTRAGRCWRRRCSPGCARRRAWADPAPRTWCSARHEDLSQRRRTQLRIPQHRLQEGRARCPPPARHLAAPEGRRPAHTPPPQSRRLVFPPARSARCKVRQAGARPRRCGRALRASLCAPSLATPDRRTPARRPHTVRTLLPSPPASCTNFTMLPQTKHFLEV